LPVFVVPPSPPRSTLSLHDALPICQQFHDLLDLALMLGRERIPGELRLVVVETGVVEMERAEQEDVGPRNALERILTGCCTRCLTGCCACCCQDHARDTRQEQSAAAKVIPHRGHTWPLLSVKENPCIGARPRGSRWNRGTNGDGRTARRCGARSGSAYSMRSVTAGASRAAWRAGR